jgi:hypothetical protein
MSRLRGQRERIEGGDRELRHKYLNAAAVPDDPDRQFIRKPTAANRSQTPRLDAE